MYRDADLFSRTEAADPSTAEQTHLSLPPHQRAAEALARVLRASHPVQLQFSSGKDSSACANLLLNAAILVQSEGLKCPPIHVVNVDTGVESPVVRGLADMELTKMRRFASTHRLPVSVHVVRPSLSSSYPTRVLGGRTLPPFPTGKRECTVDFKVRPSEKIGRSIRMQTEPGGQPLVTVIGTRSSESKVREISTGRRGESAHQIWHGISGEAFLSPVLDWDTTDVWMYLGECAAGEHLAYSDFAALMEFYADAGASSCVVVADLKAGANAGACGARSGCWVCGAVKDDHSVQNMIETNPERYPYLVPLMEFRDYLVKTQWDWSLRNFIGRTINKEGSIAVKADQYSPQMCENLLRYLLAAQDKANSLNPPSRVNALGIRELIAIDFYWSLRAWHPPFHALWVYLDHCAGNVVHAPKVDSPLRPSEVPNLGSIYVGTDWDDNQSPLMPSGLRHPLWEMHSESCGPSLRVGANGKTFLSLEESPEFEVDEEGAYLFFEFEAQRMIDLHHHSNADWTSAASIYLQYGTVSLAKGQSSAVDDMMRRSQWLQRHDLHGHRSADEMLRRCSVLSASQSDLFA